MTAVVGVLNKQAVAIAADSAVTIGNGLGTKIFNGANKIFTLSKFHPVGIMIYNNATFLGVPWETIIKVYRNKMGDKSFPRLQDYQNDFIQFLRNNNFFDEEDNYLESINGFIIALFEKDIFRRVYNSLSKGNPQIEKEILLSISQVVDEYIRILSNQNKICVDFEGYEFEEFLKSHKTKVQDFIKSLFDRKRIKLEESLLNKILHLIFLAIISKNVFLIHTGLVFTGFGEDDIFPSLTSLKISFPIGKRLKYTVEDGNVAKISVKNQSAIIPFAQKDVIETILSGIDPTYESTIIKNFQMSLEKYNELLYDTLKSTNPDLAAQIKRIDNSAIIDELRKTNDNFKQFKYINPLMSAVATLSKEDLAEMAESLIYLTYLKRRITFAQESVGGPVDVAIISKGDGFVWIKRKHYFDPKFNPTFIQNYLNI
ncbi:hypothetical protein A33Q_1573 [Indibacter alkaliphilus LW1]|uniref:Uncharacterized protein n=1 Tax=Indibacter alkaliphilus (strain CCUG 57479 / KCTC 22604 / LW1) TaxID=1189612 RepID=S2E0F8_INDAL|nr:hypothetical protein [Indibacter alkaliphilus]EOZ97921.1 hypothetical protein A33Q_1573 [Indibacter alkaliphilus LW1]